MFAAEEVSKERNSAELSEGPMVFTAGMEELSQPRNTEYIHKASIQRLVGDYNIQQATYAVKRNKGAPGIDGMKVDEVDQYMETHWPTIKRNILLGKYFPQPVKRVEIPKPDGQGVRKLGIPTVIDRIIQQAILQEIVFCFEPIFSENSYGFRIGRSTHQAIFKAQDYIKEGYEWVVDIDLEKFFDKVNHDMLMARVARRVKDKEILRLIRRFLESGIMDNGIIEASDEGTPQGGPLSPLLSNIMLDDFDKELEKRGHRFVRYADDCNIYVKTETAGRRVMESAIKYLSKTLKLKVNLDKSDVDRPYNRKFLGFSFTNCKNPNRIKVHESRIKRFKDKVKEIIKKAKGTKMNKVIKDLLMPTVRGWFHYFKIAEATSIFGSIDSWIRRKIRCYLWKQWKTSKKRFSELTKRGIKRKEAKDLVGSGKGSWHISNVESLHKALTNKVLEEIGYVSMKTMLTNLVQSS